MVRASDSRWKGWEFESRQERRENFLVQSQLCVLTLYSVSASTPCYGSGTLKTPVILPKVQVAGSKHAYTLDPTKSEWADNMLLSRLSVGTYQETSSHATRHGTLGHSRLSSLSHCGLILA